MIDITKEEMKRERARQRRLELKYEVFKMYGGPRCACCGLTCLLFLTVDHIDGSGAKHRKEIKKQGYSSLYRWLRDNHYPSGYQILCFNCNIGSFLNGGICPHHHVKIRTISDMKTRVKIIVDAPQKIYKNLDDKRTYDYERVLEFFNTQITSPVTIAQILERGQPLKFKPWSRDRVRTLVLNFLSSGHMILASRPSGRRPATYAVVEKVVKNSDDSGFEL